MKTSWLKKIITLTPLVVSLTATGSFSESTTPTPEQSVQTLRAGNERFVSGHPIYPNLSADRREEVAKGQHPFAAVLSCADSRVSPELLFDAGLGELFVVRVAGNVADNDEIASLEYAVEHLHVPVITVLGHSSCGAVKAVVAGAQVHGSIPALVDNIIPAVQEARASAGKKSEDEIVTASIQGNVFQSMSDLLIQSDIIRHHVAEGKVRLIGGVYSLSSGAVNWLGQHPNEAALLAHAGETPVSTDRMLHPAHAEYHDDGSAFTSAHPDGINPRDAFYRLILGNLRFADEPVASVTRPNRSNERRTQLAKGQRPWATVLTCSDSRVAPEHLFDAGLGDLFVVRVAGNVADIDEIGSIEYAVGHLKTPLIAVLGHSSCGAVTAACSGGELPGHLPGLLDNMEPAVERASHRTSSEKQDEKVVQAIRENVFQSMSDLMTQSGEIMAYVQAGAVKIVGGVYYLKTGRIEWLGEHPDQPSVVASLLADKKLGIDLEEVTAHGSKSTPGHAVPGHAAPVQTAPAPASSHHAEPTPAPKEKSEATHDSHGAETTAKKPHH